eukprot:CAMPEP_0194061596 /NCGR_PEP_ID=MMETSP0009_2-20130614/75133_1 /TAXON_ID=210454 /ORGANISM="Grammatophora oceanica, Strain CCMP 410" /LENGTH=194 /DNA_ID=CAMNT_0038712991 /DNA_START=164 /DNA_END=748 /DNA_ORIENTATION=-
MRWIVSKEREMDDHIRSTPLLVVSLDSRHNEFVDLMIDTALLKGWVVVDATMDQHDGPHNIDSLLEEVFRTPRGPGATVYFVSSLETKALLARSVAHVNSFVPVFLDDNSEEGMGVGHSNLPFPYMILQSSSTTAARDRSYINDPNCVTMAPPPSSPLALAQWEVRSVFAFMEAVTTLETKTLPLGWKMLQSRL